MKHSTAAKSSIPTQKRIGSHDRPAAPFRVFTVIKKKKKKVGNHLVEGIRIKRKRVDLIIVVISKSGQL